MKAPKKVLAVLPGLFPSTIIGIVKPLLQLSKQDGNIEFKVQLSRLCSIGDIRKADVIVFCRNCESDDLKFLNWAKRLGKKVVYEIDDNFFDISTKTLLGKYHRNPGRLYAIKEFLTHSDIVHVYSNPLLEIASLYTKNVKKINSYFDFRLIDGFSYAPNSSKVKIAYATSRGKNDELSATFERSLARILQDYGNRVELYTWGEIPDVLKQFTNVIKLPFVRDYNKFVKTFMEYQFDIGLAPLKDDLFHRSKTNNKYREYGACRVAGIYSNVDVYTDCVRHQETGLIVSNTEQDWYAAIRLLIEDERLRERIKDTAHNDVREKYSIDHSVKTWSETLREVQLANKKRIAEGNVGEINMLAVIDRESEVMLRARITSYFEACNFYQVRLGTCYHDDDTSYAGYDAIVFFTLKWADISGIVKTLMDKLGSSIIVDLAFPPSKDEIEEVLEMRKTSRVTVITTQSPDTNIHVIRNHFDPSLHSRNLSLEDAFLFANGSTITYELFENHKSLEQLFTLFQQVPEQFKKNKEAYYSLSAPVVGWLEIFSKIKGTYTPKRKIVPSFIERGIFRLTKPLRWAIRKLRSVVSRFEMLRKVFSTVWLLFKINILKRYG